jgi:hypothetical protein
MCQLSPHSTDPIPALQLMLRSNCHREDQNLLLWWEPASW